ncbi:hypothetical protein V3C99_017358, partial [Haemonchus contortus]|uniref:PLAC8 family protein n=1 Tax=Haemonchus contortus TaxID=6289 RepID=A0A7I4Z6C6_HAECO
FCCVPCSIDDVVRKQRANGEKPNRDTRPTTTTDCIRRNRTTTASSTVNTIFHSSYSGDAEMNG